MFMRCPCLAFVFLTNGKASGKQGPWLSQSLLQSPCTLCQTLTTISLNGPFPRGQRESRQVKWWLTCVAGPCYYYRYKEESQERLSRTIISELLRTHPSQYGIWASQSQVCMYVCMYTYVKYNYYWTKLHNIKHKNRT